MNKLIIMFTVLLAACGGTDHTTIIEEVLPKGDISDGDGGVAQDEILTVSLTTSSPCAVNSSLKTCVSAVQEFPGETQFEIEATVFVVGANNTLATVSSGLEQTTGWGDFDSVNCGGFATAGQVTVVCAGTQSLPSSVQLYVHP